MKILFATPELAPWAKTGGLGDVAHALPAALRALGQDVRVLAPAYGALLRSFPGAVEIARPTLLGGLLPVPSLREARAPDGTPLLLVDYPPFFDRPGNPYLGPEGRDWLDNHLRFGLLSRVAAWLGSAANTLDWQPDVIHCNDWQTGLAPAYLHYLPGRRAKSLLTVHNLAYQGLFDHASLFELGLPDLAWHVDGVEYHGYLSFLKAGLQHADAITTVSPSYAREIQTEAGGMGLGGLLRHRAESLHGIPNGLDAVTWNPSADYYLYRSYDAGALEARAANKAKLQQQLGLAQRSDLPLLAVTSRVTEQAGLDLLLEIAPQMLRLPAQLVAIGDGLRTLEQAWQELARKHPGECAVSIGFDESLVARIEAAADVFITPSRFAPGAFNPLYSLHYGGSAAARVPGPDAAAGIASDGGPDQRQANGSLPGPSGADALLQTLNRATAAWHDPLRWRMLQEDAVTRSSSWEKAARQYLALYRRP